MILQRSSPPSMTLQSAMTATDPVRSILEPVQCWSGRAFPSGCGKSSIISNAEKTISDHTYFADRVDRLHGGGWIRCVDRAAVARTVRARLVMTATPYVAGPDVFLPNAAAHAEKKVDISGDWVCAVFRFHLWSDPRASFARDPWVRPASGFP
jgi:hypothetical protein